MIPSLDIPSKIHQTSKPSLSSFQILSALAVGLTAGDFAARDLLKNREYNSDYRSRVAALRSRMENDDSAAAGSAQVFRDEFSPSRERPSYLPRGGRSESGRQQQRMRLRRRPQSRQSQVSAHKRNPGFN